MLNLALGLTLLLTQLSGIGGTLPQIVRPDVKPTAPVKAGQNGEITVSFNVLDGYVINHTPPINLKLTTVPGVKLEQTDLSTPAMDPKSDDEYYVDVPALTVPINAARAGNYEIPARLTYFFCSKADGFCSRQVLDFKIPVTAQ